MKIDHALRLFTENYDEEAIESIERISKSIGLKHNKSKIKVFTIKEGFDTFKEYIEGYCEHKIDTINSEDEIPHDLMCEKVRSYICNSLFEESEILYSELPSFVESYIHGVKNIIPVVDQLKEQMTESGVDQTSIGELNNFIDIFMDRLDESFDTTMDRILWASGYNTNQRIFNKSSNIDGKKVVFL